MSESDGASRDASGGPSADAVVGLGGEQFATILSDAWTNRGWETDVAEGDDGEYLVTGDQGGGQRGLILVIPESTGVTGKRLQRYAKLVDSKSVDVRVVATQGHFTDDAERIAEANDIHLLDPLAVRETVDAEGLNDRLESYLADGTAGGLLSALPVPLPAVGVPGAPALPRPGGNAVRVVLVVVLIATSLLAGFAGGAYLTPGDGPGGGVTDGVVSALEGVGVLDGGSGTDLAIAAFSTADPSSSGLRVAWNARPSDTVVANGSTYEAPNGTRFLVVQFAVTNTGEDRVPVRGGDFLASTSGTRYAAQPLDGARTFEMTALSPGNRTTGWVVYAIPENASDVVLVPNPDAAGGPMTFSHDGGLPINGTA